MYIYCTHAKLFVKARNRQPMAIGAPNIYWAQLVSVQVMRVGDGHQVH